MGKPKLIITVKTARLTRDTDAFGSMEPYCKIKYDGIKQKTKVSQGGKAPSWDETFSFNLSTSTVLNIAVWDKDTFSNDEVGSTQLDINTLKAHGGLVDWVKLYHKGKDAGEVYCEISIVDKSGEYPGAPVPGAFPTPAPGGFPTPAPGGFPTPAPGGFPTPAPAPVPAPSVFPTPAPAPAPMPGGFPTPTPVPAPGGYPTPAPGGYPDPNAYPMPTPGFPAPTPAYPSHGGYPVPGAPGATFVPMGGVATTACNPKCKKCHGTGINSKNGKKCKKAKKWEEEEEIKQQLIKQLLE
ncbi:unnamed protein product [Moneuplotes crassus]|uniref:C2 domain-containing protein n=1 Tax=Euplotes crassus TaxID=5936 RepID=A0AAD1XNG5_EUPCR|nr:unnamed protein product [Moneuplotes crassus]